MKTVRIHNHSDNSNMRLRDSNLFLEDLISESCNKKIDMVAITEHEFVGNHVKAMKLRKKYPNIKIALGNEIYLVNRKLHDTQKENNEKIKYFHFVLLAKNKKGHELLRRLSSEAWEGVYYYRRMERVPTFADRLQYYLSLDEYKGTIIGSTACVGGALGTTILQGRDARPFVKWCKTLFGDDIYLELQPSHNEEQKIVNNKILEISEELNIPYTITTDSHYKNKESKDDFFSFILSQDGDRELEDFYDATYVMSDDELLEFFPKEVVGKANIYGEEIYNKIEDFDLFATPELPPVFIPKDFDSEWTSIFKDRKDLKYIQKFLESPYEVDRYYLKLIEEGYEVRGGEHNKEEEFQRIEIELEQVWDLSIALGCRISEYHVAIKQIVDEVWKVSLVGPGRGSACCFYLNYLIDIVQVNALDYDLPFWRYMDKTKIELSDYDFDTESAKRDDIIRIMQEKYGKDNVLSFCTFSTEGAKSIIDTTCRGLGIDKDVGNNLKGLIPVIRGKAHTIEQMFFGDDEEDIKPSKPFIDEVAKYPHLREGLLKNAKLIKGRSQHASGVVITKKPYWEHNALMKTKKGIRVTQFDAHDSEECSAVKVDFLTVNFLDRMRTCFDILLEEGKIEWKGDLRTTWNSVFHPKVLDIKSPSIYEPLYKLTMSNAFQFTSAIGMNALTKLKASEFRDVYNGNSLMRLQEVEGRNPLNRYVEFKNEPQLWENEMVEYGLTEEERRVMHELFDEDNGVMSSQEKLMLSSMVLCGYTVAEANSLRKSISKKDEEKQKKEKDKLFKTAKSNGRSEKLMQYYWDYQVSFSLGYAFSIPHTICYSYVLMQGLNMFVKYGKVYWQLANLTIDAGLVGEKEKNTNYDKLVAAIGKLDNVLPCDINKSEMDFKVEGDKIRYGFRPVAGLDKDTYSIIEECKPYSSFDDFLEKMYNTGKLKEKKIIVLIKTGCFDCFNKDRHQLMINFVEKVIPVKKSLSIVQLPTLREYVQGFEYELKLYDFKNKIMGKTKVPMTKEIQNEFIVDYSKNVKYTINDKGLVIDEKDFKKFFDQKMTPLKEYLKSEEMCKLFARLKRRELWKEQCLGNTSSWEMEVYYGYFGKHELEIAPINDYFVLENFSEMGEVPPVEKYNRRKRPDGTYTQVPVYKKTRIAGTVIAKDNIRHYVTLLTTDGVVNVKFSKDGYARYTAKYTNDKSWFERGTILVVVGYRLGLDFKATYGENSVVKILQYNEENIKLLTKRMVD